MLRKIILFRLAKYQVWSQRKLKCYCVCHCKYKDNLLIVVFELFPHGVKTNAVTSHKVLLAMTSSEDSVPVVIVLSITISSSVQSEDTTNCIPVKQLFVYPWWSRTEEIIIYNIIGDNQTHNYNCHWYLLSNITCNSYNMGRSAAFHLCWQSPRAWSHKLNMSLLPMFSTNLYWCSVGDLLTVESDLEFPRWVSRSQ